MFQHQSLGIKINIQVTKLVLLRQRPAKLSIGHHGERSLESFCHWQNEEYGGARYLGNNQVPGGKDDAPPVDAAVFVTRTDFCVHKDEPCDTVVVGAYALHMNSGSCRTEEGIGSPGTGVIDSCESPCGCWELDVDPLEEQPMLLTIKLSLQPPQGSYEDKGGD
nr:A disintegrin and metalloproteinase with thrombospondin motifs 17-like [Peromyscus maniculatus bairdii]